ncbi:MAG: ech hydrogenase subunit [Desulfovibrionales bacterium]|nr:ech hydrogenase subunit [Desulfovibrionales bacterium]
MIIKYIIPVLLGVFAAPILGGLISGVDRRLTAWLQSRYGPPILQPFYDVAKLFGKKRNPVNTWQVFCAWLYCTAAMVSVIMFMLQADLLLIFFVQATGATFLVIGALSAVSPYSQIGGHRELIQILTYEPMLVLVFVGMYLVTGSFEVGTIAAYDNPLLIKLPLLFVVLGYALTIKLRKSPFDFSTSHHGHQELVKGLTTEYSGPHLALVEIGHWYEVVLVLLVVSLFWATNIFGAVILVAITYFAEIFVDNITARMTWRWMLGRVWFVGLAMSLANLVWLYAS